MEQKLQPEDLIPPTSSKYICKVITEKLYNTKRNSLPKKKYAVSNSKGSILQPH